MIYFYLYGLNIPKLYPQIKGFHIYLAPENFIVRTDNKAVRDFLINKKPIEQERRLAWYNKIYEYTFEVGHLK